MPKELHRKLTKAAKRQGLKEGSEQYGAYVYGSMNRIEKEKRKGKKGKGKKVVRGTRYNTE